MAFKSRCSCPRHEEWGYNSVVEPKLFVIQERYEEDLCGVGNSSRHKNRKRKICGLCRDRIIVEKRCKILEDDCSQSMDSSFDAPERLDSPNEDDSNQLPNCITKEIGIQVPANSGTGYQNVQERAKRKIRAEVIDEVKAVVERHCLSDEKAMCELVQEIVESSKFKMQFGITNESRRFSPETSINDSFLQSLVKDYERCKDKEENSIIRKRGKKLSGKLCIGNTFKDSRLLSQGKFGTVPIQPTNRVQVAQAIGRVKVLGDEKRRLLSIVAKDFPYSTLQQYFKCAKNTVTAARVHATLFGRGGVPSQDIKFKRQVISKEVVAEFLDFLHQDDISRPSSCRSVLVDGQETAVRYWQSSLKDVIQQYLVQFPNGVKRTYIYTHLPPNFRMDTMLAGLCNICDDSGHTNFDNVIELINDLGKKCSGLNSVELVKKVQAHQRFLKTKYSKQVDRHSDCVEMCMDYALGACEKQHNKTSPDFNQFYEICSSAAAVVRELPEAERSQPEKSLAEFQEKYWDYISHLIRTRHQGDYYRYVLKNLVPGQAVAVVDYKMKLEMGVRARENQRQWYGKRGLSLHGFYVIAQVEPDIRRAHVIDLWSEDTKQDTWFTQSALDACFGWFEKSYPGFSLFHFSDNGPHYHNTGLLLYLAEVNAVFNFHLAEYNFFEAGEGKTVLDTHFAHISHKIVRWVRLGNDFESGEKLADLIRTLDKATCLKLHINRQKAPKVGTLKDISLLANFKFPLSGDLKDGIGARSLSGCGIEMTKTKTQLATLSGRRTAIAGATGATTESQDPHTPEVATTDTPTEAEGYTVRFLQHSGESPMMCELEDLQDDAHAVQRPDEKFALKKRSGKRVMFTLQQKEIMIQFYNQQAQSSGSIRATPANAIKAMKDAGIEPLKESQIKSWWSTYHQKRKRAMQDLADDVQRISGVGSANQNPRPASQNLQQPQPPHPQPEHRQPPQDPQPQQIPCRQNASNPSTTMKGVTKPQFPGVMEWEFPAHLSQSTVDGRLGSNACTLIALHFGMQINQFDLPHPTDQTLPSSWANAFAEAIRTGNEIHDELFDMAAVNLSIDEAIEVAGDALAVESADEAIPLFGNAAKQELCSLLTDRAKQPSRTFDFLILCERTMLVISNADGTIIFVDSHQHGSSGALIASVQDGSVSLFVEWLDDMMIRNWDQDIRVCTVTRVFFK